MHEVVLDLQASKKSFIIDVIDSTKGVDDLEEVLVKEYVLTYPDNYY